MRYFKIILVCSILCTMCTASFAGGQLPQEKPPKANPTQLLVLWTSGDREVALNMVFMYTFNAKKYGWWDTIRFIVWGPSSRLLSEDEELQGEIQKMKDVGIELYACKACSDNYGVSDKLKELEIDVKYIGKDFTSMLKQGWVCLTF
jgi:hypothetical protein